MSQYLFNVQEKNRLEQKGLLRRFSVNCYGKQLTLEEIKNKKADKFKELKEKRGTREYEEWFLRYVPFENDPKNKTLMKGKNTKNTKKSTTKKSVKKSKGKREKKTRKVFGPLLNIFK